MRKNAVFSESFRELGLAVFIVILCVLFQIRNNAFLTLSNIEDLLRNTAILGILAVGMMMVLLTGGIDLSIGATIALSGMVSAMTVSAGRETSMARKRFQGSCVLKLTYGATAALLLAPQSGEETRTMIRERGGATSVRSARRSSSPAFMMSCSCSARRFSPQARSLRPP